MVFPRLTYSPCAFSFILLLFTICSFAQEAPVSGIKIIERFLDDRLFEEADSALDAQITVLKLKTNYDSLAAYTYYTGWIKHKKGNTSLGITNSEAFIAYLKSKTNDPEILWEANMEHAIFYELIGDPKKAYEKNEEALRYASNTPSATGEDLGKIESNLGAYAYRFGDLSLSQFHHRRALQHYTSYPETNLKNYYISYNAMGTIMWFSSKTDSALYYYSKALENLKKMDPDPKNKYYRQAIVKNNMVALLDTEGKKTEALQMMREVIEDLEAYIHADISSVEREKAYEFKFQAIDNLGGIYRALGDNTKALELLKYAFLQKQKHFDPDSPEIFKSMIMIGQAELALKNFETARAFLDKGIEIIGEDDQNLYWSADAHYSKALLNEQLGNTGEAAYFYNKSDQLYQAALAGDYDNIYLEFLTRASHFYAATGRKKKAKEIAFKGYNYIVKTQGEHTLQSFLQILNLAEVHYELGEYDKSLHYSEKGIDILNQVSSSSRFFIDSVQIEFNKPTAILIKAKSQFQLQENKDQEFLEGLLNSLDTAIAILERHKSIFSSHEDLSVLIHNNKEVFDFAKKIALDLYFINKDEKFLDRALGFHESGLYNRIRSRLNAIGAIQFVNIPERVYHKEKKLRENIQKVLKGTSADGDESIQTFIQATAQWESFLQELKKGFPDYYKFRYATIAEPAATIHREIPEQTSVVRYFFAGSALYALVMDKKEKHLVALNYDPGDSLIAKLNNPRLSLQETAPANLALYRSLWAPLTGKIAHSRVIIIPDGDLFNLSFEMLSPSTITSYADFEKESLLATHTLSYNYSLLLLKAKAPEPAFEADFIAFAPGFFDEIKEAYLHKIKDSVLLDKAYMRLLPQPFTLDLVNRLHANFGGEIYVKDHSTKSNFLVKANRHKILHIGAHAESNNLSPELSRLIFAKDLNQPAPADDNVLHAYEIYN